jgi:hypothetical protein
MRPYSLKITHEHEYKKYLSFINNRRRLNVVQKYDVGTLLFIFAYRGTICIEGRTGANERSFLRYAARVLL